MSNYMSWTVGQTRGCLQSRHGIKFCTLIWLKWIFPYNRWTFQNDIFLISQVWIIMVFLRRWVNKVMQLVLVGKSEKTTRLEKTSFRLCQQVFNRSKMLPLALEFSMALLLGRIWSSVWILNPKSAWLLLASLAHSSSKSITVVRSVVISVASPTSLQIVFLKSQYVYFHAATNRISFAQQSSGAIHARWNLEEENGSEPRN